MRIRVAAYAAIFVLWGASFLAIREVVRVCPPFLAAGIRFGTAGALLFGYARMRRMPLPTLLEWRNLAVLGVVMFVGDYGGLFWSEQHLASGLAAVIAATIPGSVFLLEWVWLRRVQLTWLTALGLLLGIGGVAVLLLPSGFHLDRYAAVALGASCCWSVGTVLSTRMVLPKARAVSSAAQMLMGGAGLLAVSGVAGEWGRSHLNAWDGKAVWSMAYLVVGASLLAFSAYVYLLSREPASRVASYAYVNPLIALALGSGLAGERLTTVQVIACAAVIAGVFATWQGKQAAAAPAGSTARV